MTFDQTSVNTDTFPERPAWSKKWYTTGELSDAFPGPLSVQLVPTDLCVAFRLRSLVLAWATSEVCCAGLYLLLTSALPWWLEFPAWPQTCLVTTDLRRDRWAFSWPQSPSPSVPWYQDFMTVAALSGSHHPQLPGPLLSWSSPCLLLLTGSSKCPESQTEHHGVCPSVCAGNTWGFW